MSIVAVVGVSLLLTMVFILSNSGDDSQSVSDTHVNQQEERIPTANDSTPRSDQNNQEQLLPSESSEIYEAFVQYLTPRGSRESINVELTIEDGVIIDSDIEYEANSSDARFYQSSFNSEYKSRVIGKRIDEVKLSRVGGASLTTAAFMKALDEISKKI